MFTPLPAPLLPSAKGSLSPSLFSAVPVLSSCTISSPGHAEAARASGSKNHPCGVVRARPSPRANGTKRRMWRPQIHRLAVTSSLAPGMSADSIAPPGLLTKTRLYARPMPLLEGTYYPLLSRITSLITQLYADLSLSDFSGHHLIHLSTRWVKTMTMRLRKLCFLLFVLF